MSLEEILMSDDVSASINNNMDTMLSLIPEIAPCIGFEHKSPYHHLDVWEHTLLALSMAPMDFEARLVLLLHDIGKPLSYQVDGDIRHFRGHTSKSRELASGILERLGYSGEFASRVLKLIEGHDTPMTEEVIKADYDFAYKMFVVQECDSFAHKLDMLGSRIEYLGETEKLLRKYKK